MKLSTDYSNPGNTAQCTSNGITVDSSRSLFSMGKLVLVNGKITNLKSEDANLENKETFNLVTNEYERYRPLYPSEMFDDIFTYLNLNKEDSILEIGCGTGRPRKAISIDCVWNGLSLH